MMTNILLFLNKGFETMEFSPFVDICGWPALIIVWIFT